ncbi:MAG: diacylglycerol kinase family protein [Flavobacteriia bacterium]|nr:diacylglycerol kinase family protein [Flavobacteriia bacterium]
MKNRIQAFGFALSGVRSLLREPHFRFHSLAFLLVITSAWYFGVTRTEWTILLLTSALVLALEGLNSGIENLADALHPEIHPLIKKSKDVAAGAVLLAAILAAAIGIIIFTPYITALVA